MIKRRGFVGHSPWLFAADSAAENGTAAEKPEEGLDGLLCGGGRGEASIDGCFRVKRAGARVQLRRNARDGGEDKP